MRISTNQLYQASLNAMLDNQSSLQTTQLQLSSGQRILKPSDDPTASTAVLDVNQLIASTQQFQRNADAARGRLERAESLLGSAGDLLQRFRELTLQANNDSQNRQTRASIAFEMRELRQQLFSLANSQDANGDYLFAGFQGQTQPFQQNASSQVAYVGDANSRYLQVGPSQQTADGDPGSAVFMAIRNGNGTFTTRDGVANTGTGIIDPGTVVNPSAFVREAYTLTFVTNSAGAVAINVSGSVSGQLVPALPAVSPAAAPAYVDGATISFNGVQTSIRGAPAVGDTFTVSPSINQDIFSTLQNLIITLEGPQSTSSERAALHNSVNRALTDMDQAMGNLLKIRARAGGRLNALESQTTTNDGFLLHSQQALSALQDLDYAEAASRLQRQILSLEAAQQTFARVQGLSLFNFLR